MTSPINPVRRPQPSRRTKRARAGDEATGAEAANLPVPVEPVSRPVPPEPVIETHAVFAAQLLGQGGEKRGLRAGKTLVDAANSSYKRTEWSGSKDRRTRAGKHAKTEV